MTEIALTTASPSLRGFLPVGTEAESGRTVYIDVLSNILVSGTALSGTTNALRHISWQAHVAGFHVTVLSSKTDGYRDLGPIVHPASPPMRGILSAQPGIARHPHLVICDYADVVGANAR